MHGNSSSSESYFEYLVGLSETSIKVLREMAPDLAVTRAISKFTGNEADLDEVTQVCRMQSNLCMRCDSTCGNADLCMPVQHTRVQLTRAILLFIAVCPLQRSDDNTADADDMACQRWHKIDTAHLFRCHPRLATVRPPQHTQKWQFRQYRASRLLHE